MLKYYDLAKLRNVFIRKAKYFGGKVVFLRCFYILNFRMWFKYGLKAQKLLAQGIALGMMAISKTPCKGKSLMFCLEF